MREAERDAIPLAKALYLAIDWDFVEVFRGEDEPGYASPMDLCQQVAARVTSPDDCLCLGINVCSTCDDAGRNLPPTSTNAE